MSQRSREQRQQRQQGGVPWPCVLCGAGGAEFIGIYAPGPVRNALIGAPAGKQRLVPYWLCQECLELPDVLQRVESELIAVLAVPERN